MRVWRLALAIALCPMLFIGCDREGDAAIWIAETHAAHRAADRALAERDTRVARDTLELAALSRPPRDAPKNAVRAIRQDLFYRLASLELETKHPERALDWASQGLALGETPDIFTSNLRIVRGRTHEALGELSAAAKDYHAALLISEHLLEAALGGKRE